MNGRGGVSVAGAAILLLAMVGGGVGLSGQSGTGVSPQRPLNPDASARGLGEPNRPDDPFSGKLAEQQARGRNSERQKKLVADTDKLLSLATELKQQVDKTDKNMLSVDVVKKADEIEKLAHSVKEKMKGGA